MAFSRTSQSNLLLILPSRFTIGFAYCAQKIAWSFSKKFTQYFLKCHVLYSLLNNNVAHSNVFRLFQESFYCGLSSLANQTHLRYVCV